MTVEERFLKYIAVDTTSDPSSDTFPSTKSQLDFAAALREEMESLGLENVSIDQYGYVFGTIPSTIKDYSGKILGFISHMDTSCAESGKNIRPRIIKRYDGKDIVLNEEKNIIMSPRDFSNLAQYQGQDLIVTDGNTLLGGDDKAGIAEILTAAEYLLAHPEIPHGPVRVGFTPDEEIGQGTEHFDVEKFGADFAYTMDGGECGELEYEKVEDEKEGRYISIHIPSDADMKEENLRKSLQEAGEFFQKYYPGWSRLPYKCCSWLLSPALKGLLGEGSRILAFQDMFQIEEVYQDSDAFLEWVFKRKDIPLEELSEDTSLQRNMKAHLLSGGWVGEGMGSLKPE